MVAIITTLIMFFHVCRSVCGKRPKMTLHYFMLSILLRSRAILTLDIHRVLVYLQEYSSE